MKINGGKHRIFWNTLLLFVVVLVSQKESWALGTSGPGTEPAVEPSILKALEWRLIGPYRGGRSVAVAGHPTKRLVFYMATTGGGVWKTENGGHSWHNVSDGFVQTGSVGAIAVSDSDPDVVYVGMGEESIRGNTSHGDGVYKSTDGGKTWKHIGLADTQHIGDILIHPENPDLVYVAAMGHAFGPNEERGVFRSKDGGRTWEKVLYRNENVGAVDLSWAPSNPNVIYVTLWEFRRYPWAWRSGGAGSGIFKTEDGGDTWVEITTNAGLPTGSLRGKIGISVSPVEPSRVWAIIEAEGDHSGVYRSDDAGSSWQVVSQKADLSQRPWYYHHIFADSKDPETVYVLNTRMWKSADGGQTYVRIPTPHGDNHDLWIDPKDPNRMVEANDGGATISFNGGQTWSTIYNQPTAQMYHVTTDNQFPYRVYGPQQDNSTISLPSRSRFGAITHDQYYPVGGSEAGYIAVHPENPNLVFAADHHWLTRYHHDTQQKKYISAWPEIYYGWGSADMKFRFQWTYPVRLSPHNPEVLYVTSQYVHRSSDQGHSWEVISPDLTRAAPSTLETTIKWGDEGIGKYWGPIKRDNTGVEWYATIFAFEESPVQPGLLWSGSDDGLIHLSKDGGKTWDNVTPQELPEFALISIIDPSPHDPATAYVAATRYKLDDFQPYLYRTKDYGKTWTKITGGIPGNDFTRVIREDPSRRGLLYAGTETAIYVSLDHGESWQSLQLNLPVVPIHDLVVKDQDLIAATHGRSFWILDDLTVLHQITDDVQSASAYLFKPRTTVRFRETLSSPLRSVQSPPVDRGENPPNGVLVHYLLKEKPEGEITMTFLDTKGQVIETYSSGTSASEASESTEGMGAEPNLEGGRTVLPARAGGNRFVWADMRYPGPVELEGAFFRRYEPEGPLAPPGTYEVRLTVGGETYSRSFEIVKDPRIAATQADFEEQFELLIGVRDKITETHQAVQEIREIRRRLEETVQSAKGKPQAPQVAKDAETINDRLYSIEDVLVQFRAKATQDLINYPVRLNDKLSTLAAFVESDDSRPTEQQHALFKELSAILEEQLQRLRELKEKDLAAFDRQS